MALHPARQLNSKTIRDAAMSYVVPVVQKRFCVVSANCVWRVEGSDNAKAWELICEKRAECDNTVADVSGVAFFFSSITSREARTNAKKCKSGAESASSADADEPDVEENVPCSQSSASDVAMATCSAIKAAVEKGRLPTIAYWIAFESRNGAPVSLVQLHRQLLECEVEIDTKILTTRNGAPEMMKKLCIVIKDHSSSYMNDIVEASSRSCTMEAVAQLPGGDEFRDEENQLNGERPLRFVRVKDIYAKEVRKMIKALIRAGLTLDVDGLDLEEVDEDNEHGNTSNVEGTTNICYKMFCIILCSKSNHPSVVFKNP